VLKTFFPDLRARRGLLVGTLPAIASYLRDHAQANANELGEFVCDQAQAETKRDPRKLCWRELLPWLPKLMPTLLKDSDLLRRLPATPHLWRLALSVLADYFDVSSSALQRTMEQKTRPIAPGMMRQLIERTAVPLHGAIAAKKKRKRGRQLGVTLGDTGARLLIAADCRLQGMTDYPIAAEMYPGRTKPEAWNAAKRILNKYARKIGDEQQRLAAMTKPERMAAVQSARERVRVTAAS
jgi:hypothetical protein